jgi:hypothetical protein
MTAATAGARRTYQPVRRESFDVDDPRAQVFRPIPGGAKFVDALLACYDEWADLRKQAGKAHELSANCKKVLEVLLRRCTDYGSGICEPCLDTLQRMTRFARATIVRALRILRTAGFVRWLRRTAPTDNPPREGPQVRQVSNAYWFDLAELPRRVAMAVKARLRKKSIVVDIPREPRQPLFTGRRRAKSEERRRSLSERWTSASWPERAAILHPRDPDRQAEYLAAVLGESASSAGGLNPQLNTERKAEWDR